MRTTLNLDDDVLRAARSLAAARRVTLSEAVSALARRGLEPRPVPHCDPLPAFAVPDDARPITLDDVRRLEDIP